MDTYTVSAVPELTHLLGRKQTPGFGLAKSTGSDKPGDKRIFMGFKGGSLGTLLCAPTAGGDVWLTSPGLAQPCQAQGEGREEDDGDRMTALFSIQPFVLGGPLRRSVWSGQVLLLLPL